MPPDKFVAGGIITKLPPSWRNFAALLKHKRQEFSVPDLIGTLDVEEKARAKDNRARGIEGGSSANLVQKKNFQPHKFKNKGKFDGKAKFDGKNKAVQHTNFKKKNDKKKGACHVCVVILIIGLLVVLITMTSVILGKAARPLMLSLETLT